jgi:hypothetical protein
MVDMTMAPPELITEQVARPATTTMHVREKYLFNEMMSTNDDTSYLGYGLNEFLADLTFLEYDTAILFRRDAI